MFTFYKNCYQFPTFTKKKDVYNLQSKKHGSFKENVVLIYNRFVIFPTDKQHICGKQKMVFAVPLDIAVIFRNQKS